jgi:hypothetical protein
MEQLGPHWIDFRKIRYFFSLLKSVNQIQVRLKSDQMWQPFDVKAYVTLWQYLALYETNIRNTAENESSKRQLTI